MNSSLRPTKAFSERLLDWHARHGRHDLPWQNTRDPYRIWLSEIMLQQTQVDTVIPYYERFLLRFPDLASLASAPLDDVLGLWSGLGYYARARNLHKAAQAVMSEHDGSFPQDAETIATLPGIGRSTAAAIAAFAFGQRGAILDGNVKRVLCRHQGVEGYPGERVVESRLWDLAEALLPKNVECIGRYIQAQMDLGATLCTRGRPACGRCPVAEDCVAQASGRTSELPAARPRKAVPKREARMAVIRSELGFLLERRPPNGIWGGLLSLPELPGADATEDAGWLTRSCGIEARTSTTLEPLEHVFSHFRLTIRPTLFEAQPTQGVAEDRFAWIPFESLDIAGLPAPVRTILKRITRRPIPDS